MTSSSTLVLTEYVAFAGGPENMDRPWMQWKSNRNKHIQTGSLKLPQWLKLEVDSMSLLVESLDPWHIFVLSIMYP